MSARRVSADPDMHVWLQQLMESDETKGAGDRSNSKTASDDTLSMCFMPSPSTASKEEMIPDNEDGLSAHCKWKSPHAHKGLTHEEIARKNWYIIYGRRYLRGPPELYRYTACILGQSLLTTAKHSSIDQQIVGNRHRHIRKKRQKDSGKFKARRSAAA